MTEQLSTEAIFERLLAGESVTVIDPPSYLRVSLHKRFRSYKDTFGAYGFLSEKIANSSLSAKKSPEGGVIFSLSQKKQPVTYSILSLYEPPTSTKSD